MGEVLETAKVRGCLFCEMRAQRVILEGAPVRAATILL